MPDPWGSLTEFDRSIQEIAAVLQARDLLERLADFRKTRRIPSDVRAEARALLRWYPRPERLRPVLEGPQALLKKGKPEGKPIPENQNPCAGTDLKG